MREAAQRLAAIARFLADIRRLRSMDRSAIPTDPAWERTVNNTILLSAIARVYRAASVGAGTYKALAPPEQLAQYRRDFELVVPTVFRRAQRALPGQIMAMSMRLVPLAMALVNPKVVARVHRNVLSLREKPGGLQLAPLSTPKEQFNELRRRLAPHVAQTGDPILSIIFAHPMGVHILWDFADRGPQAGQKAALNAVEEAGSALSDLYAELVARPVGLWRSPRLIWLAAGAEGLGDMPDLRLFLTAIGAGYLDDPIRPWLTFAGIAFGLLAMVFAPPAGIGVASLMFGGLGLVTQAVELPMIARADYEQNVAATATGFEVEEARLGASGWGATGLAASMLLISAIVIFLEVSKVSGPVGGAPADAPAKTPTRGPLDMKAKGIAGSDASAGRTSGVATGGDAAAGETARSPRPTPSLTQGAAQAPPTASGQAPQPRPLPEGKLGSMAPLQEGVTSPAMPKPLDVPSASTRPHPDERLAGRPTSPRDSPEVGARLVERPNTPPKRELPPYPDNQYRGAAHGGSARVREVPIGGSAEATMAHEGRLRLMREGAIDYNENIAVVRYRNPRTNAVGLAWAKSNADEHAERVLESWLKAEFGPDYNPGIIEKLYTERIPCGPESRNCYAWMRSDLYNAEIEYSFATHTIPATPTTPARTIDANQELKSFYIQNFDAKGNQRFRE